MKSPTTGKEMIIVTRKDFSVIYKNEEYEIFYMKYKCEDTGELFIDDELESINLLQVIAKYEERHKKRVGIDYINHELNEVVRFIHERAVTENLSDKDIDERLFDLDNNPFDEQEVRENHEYDLGRYFTLMEIKKAIEKYSIKT